MRYDVYGWMDRWFTMLVHGGDLTRPVLGAARPCLPVEWHRATKTKFSPEVKLVWDASADNLLYFSWAEGFKSGSYDFRANNKNFYARHGVVVRV